MSRTTAYLALAASFLLGGAVFAIERSLALSQARESRETATRELEDALKLAARHPGAFGAGAAPAGESALKTLAQDLAAKRSLAIGFLSETDREAERGRRERQVIVRLVHPVHGNLVRFLGDLEAQGGGARIKEIHVRPSTSEADRYEEAEVVVVRVRSADAP